MSIEILTKNDLKSFEANLLSTIKNIIADRPIDTQKKWIKTKELEELFGISQGKQQQLRNEGVLPFTRIGQTVYYLLSDIEEILEKNKAK